MASGSGYKYQLVNKIPGSQLARLADNIAHTKGYRRMAVISAVGTRQYYLERGFERGELYLVKQI
jgi:elongator complex protein 3